MAESQMSASALLDDFPSLPNGGWKEEELGAFKAASSQECPSQAFRDVLDLSRIMEIWNDGIDSFLFDKGGINLSMCQYEQVFHSSCCEPIQKAAILSCIAGNLEKQGNGNYDEALDVHRRALVLAEECVMENGEEESRDHVERILCDIAVNLELSKNLNGALEAYSRLVNLQNKRCKHSLAVANTLSLMSSVHARQNNLHEAVSCLTSALKITIDRTRDCSRKLRKCNKEDLAHILSRLGDLYFRKGDLDSALRMHHKALDRHRALSQDIFSADSLASLSSIYAGKANQDQSYIEDRSKLFHQAAVYMEKALKLWMMLSDQGNHSVQDKIARARNVISYLQRSEAKQKMTSCIIESAKSPGSEIEMQQDSLSDNAAVDSTPLKVAAESDRGAAPDRTQQSFTPDSAKISSREGNGQKRTQQEGSLSQESTPDRTQQSSTPDSAKTSSREGNRQKRTQYEGSLSQESTKRRRLGECENKSPKECENILV